jgi:hypothetical protein
MWAKLFSFFTNIFDTVGGWFKTISDGLTWMSTQRMFLVGSVVASVKVLYDFTVSGINEAISSMEAVRPASEVAGEISVIGLMEFANSLVPLSETFAMMTALVEFWLACTLVKMILCFIPTIK